MRKKHVIIIHHFECSYLRVNRRLYSAAVIVIILVYLFFDPQIMLNYIVKKRHFKKCLSFKNT